MIQDILDNPVWHALTTGNKSLSQGTTAVKHFIAGVSPIAGMETPTAAHLQTLCDLTHTQAPVLVFSVAENLLIPNCWNVLLRLSGYQMLYTSSAVPAFEEKAAVLPLAREHVPQMLALTALTNPGPFSERTIEFGHYEGIFCDGNLVAMAGQRLYPQPYAEISAVCTHPAHVGKGFARQLLLRQVRRMLAADCIPFLHVRDDNSRAIALYRQAGFEISRPMYFFVLQKNTTQV